MNCASPRWRRQNSTISFLLSHSGYAALSLALTPIIQGDKLATFGDITLRDQSNPLQMLDWMRRNWTLLPWPPQIL
jgi:hypothetical protein